MAALTAPDCAGLASDAERQVCSYYQTAPDCQGAEAILLLANPEPLGTDYDCQQIEEILLANRYVPQDSVEWTKTRRDLVEVQRKEFVASLKAKPPLERIRQQTLADNPLATERDVQFALQEYYYEQGNAFSAEVDPAAIQAIVQDRYAPYGVARNLAQYRQSNPSGRCADLAKRYQVKIYGELANIPPHLALIYSDYINQDNQCLCRK